MDRRHDIGKYHKVNDKVTCNYILPFKLAIWCHSLSSDDWSKNGYEI